MNKYLFYYSTIPRSCKIKTGNFFKKLRADGRGVGNGLIFLDVKGLLGTRVVHQNGAVVLGQKEEGAGEIPHASAEMGGKEQVE